MASDRLYVANNLMNTSQLPGLKIVIGHCPPNLRLDSVDAHQCTSLPEGGGVHDSAGRSRRSNDGMGKFACSKSAGLHSRVGGFQYDIHVDSRGRRITPVSNSMSRLGCLEDELD
jgi:hypothetical protein